MNRQRGLADTHVPALASCPLCKSSKVVLTNCLAVARIRCNGCGLTLKRSHIAGKNSGIAAVIEIWNARNVSEEWRDPEMLQHRIRDLEKALDDALAHQAHLNIQ